MSMFAHIVYWSIYPYITHFSLYTLAHCILEPIYIHIHTSIAPVLVSDKRSKSGLVDGVCMFLCNLLVFEPRLTLFVNVEEPVNHLL